MKRILLHALLASLSLSALSFCAQDSKDFKDKDSKDSKTEKTADKPRRSNFATAAKLVRYAGAAAPMLEDIFGDDIDPKYITALQKAGMLISEVTDRRGSLDLEKLTKKLAKAVASKEMRKQAIISLLGKLQISEAEINRYIDLDKAVTAISIDTDSEEIVSLDREALLRAINNKPFSEKVANLLKVPTEAVQQPLDAAKHILGEPVIQEHEAFNDELLSNAQRTILKLHWQLGALNGAQTVARSPKIDELHKNMQQRNKYLGLLTGYANSATAVLSACGTYLVWSNPYTAAGYTALAGAAACFGWAHREKQKAITDIAAQKQKIDEHVKSLTVHKRSNFKAQTKALEDEIQAQGQIIANQIALQRKYAENRMQLSGVRSQVVGLGLMGAMNYLIDEETMKKFLSQSAAGAATAGAAAAAQEPDLDPALQEFLKSEYGQAMTSFLRGLQKNPKALAAIGDEETLAKAVAEPFVLLENELFKQTLTKAEKQALIGALTKYIIHTCTAIQTLKFGNEIALFKVQPVSIINALALLATLTVEQLKALHGIFELSNLPRAEGFKEFLELLTKAHMEKLSNPALLLIAEFNPQVLLGQKDFMASIAADEELQKAIAALLNSKSK